MDYEDPDERLFNLFIRAMESETNLYSDVQVSNCKFGNFHANFIFRPICDIKNLRLGLNLPLSVNDRVISLFSEGFIFMKLPIYIFFAYNFSLTLSYNVTHKIHVPSVHF